MIILDMLENAEHNIKVGIEKGIPHFTAIGLSQLQNALREINKLDKGLFDEAEEAKP